jgi:hypothetical protein
VSASLALITPAMLGALNGPGISLPYDVDILLLECYVAGTSYVEDIESIEPSLEAGAILLCRREPSNEHDALAILVLDAQGRKLGYVPRAKNEVLARLMDAGKNIYARLVSKEWQESWLRLGVEVRLHEL